MFNTRLTASANGVRQKTTIPRPTSGKTSATGNSHDVTASWYPEVGMGGPASTMTFGGPQFTTLFQGILPENNESALTPYYRDIYYYDSVAGSAVDISSTFPFSDLALTGLESEDLKIYNETLSRINIRTLMQEVSNNYLIDGRFTGTLIYDPSRAVFQDVLVHDSMNTVVSPQPFHAMDPVIQVNSSHVLNRLFGSGSPYLDSVLSSYPPNVVDRYRQGSVILDPLTTMYIPRKGAADRESVSYLKRILPMYMFERVLYRGTLIEAQKRQRPTSHIKAGGENWIPTDAELEGILSAFQRTEHDPLGAWIVTRQDVEVSDVRSPNDTWKWTDQIDTLVPYKLRALGISEAFLSGDASFATAEAAITVFLDSMDAYRQMLTYKIFTRKIFPLVAVLNGMYRDPKLSTEMDSVSGIIANLSNHKNLRIPTVNWFKSLNGRDTESQWDMLDKLSEKGFTIPLKMWAAAASVDVTALLQDLEEDQKIKDAIEKVTGKSASDMGVHEDLSGLGEDSGEFPSGPGLASLMKKGTKLLSNRAQSSRIPLLSREMNPNLVSISKSGRVAHSVVRENVSASKSNDLIVKAMRALQDPHRRAQVRSNLKAKGLNLG